MQIRQICWNGVGGLKSITSNTVAQLKYDGSSYHLHVADSEAYGLTSKRVSKKTDELSEKLANFPRLKKHIFKTVKETIWVTEAVAEHLEKIAQKDKCGYVAGICNSREARIIGSDEYESLTEKPKDAIQNDLALVVHDVLYYEGKYVFDLPYIEKYKLIAKHFPSAGRYGEKINLKKGVLWAIENIPIEDQEHADIVFNYVAYELKREGIVLKDLDSNLSLKVKQERTADVFIIGYTDGKAGVTGKYLGKVGAVVLGVFNDDVKVSDKIAKRTHLTKEEITQYLTNGEIIKVGQTSGFDDFMRDNFTNQKDYYLGRIMETTYMSWTGKAMRHPRFLRMREDKHVGRVTKEQFEV